LLVGGEQVFRNGRKAVIADSQDEKTAAAA
jgi:hypothetical protein